MPRYEKKLQRFEVVSRLLAISPAQSPFFVFPIQAWKENAINEKKRASSKMRNT